MAKPYQIKLRRTTQTIDDYDIWGNTPDWWKSAQGDSYPVDGEPIVITSGQDKLIAIGDDHGTKPKFFKAFKASKLKKFTFWKTGTLTASTTTHDLISEDDTKLFPTTDARAVHYNSSTSYPDDTIGKAVNEKANRSGDTLTGATLTSSTVSAAPTSNLGIANKAYVDAAINDAISTKAHTWYGTCSTAASTQAKVVTCSNYSLLAGSIISVLFSTDNTAAAVQLNVNGTGAKSVSVGTTSTSATNNVLKWSANTLVTFIYDGSIYRYISSVSAADIQSSRGANTWYGTSTIAVGTTAKTSTIANFVLTPGAIVSVTFTNGNTANAPTLNINSTGAKAIWYNNAATSPTNKLTISANETVTFIYDGTKYHVIGMSGFATKSYVNDQIAAGLRPVISISTPSNTNVLWIKPVTATVNNVSTTELILHVYYNSGWRPVSSIW